MLTFSLSHTHALSQIARLTHPASTLVSSYASGKGLHSQFVPCDFQSPLLPLAEQKSSSGTCLAGEAITGSEENRHLNTMMVKGEMTPLLVPPDLRDMRPRCFSAREAARLQGFPETYKITTGRKSWYRMIGNAVSPPVIAAIAGSILCALQHQGQHCHCAGVGLAINIAVEATASDRREALLTRVGLVSNC